MRGPEFRALEPQAILQLQPKTPSILALGGGSLLSPLSRQYLQKMGQLVYLKAGFKTLEKRIFKEGIPPFISQKNPSESLEQLYQKRVYLFEQIPAQIVDVDEMEEEEILFALCNLVNEKELFHGL